LKVLSSIKPEKDVDCFHPENCGLLMHNRPRFRPCTPAGILELFAYYGIQTKGANIAIVNRSIVVGEPLSVLLTNEGNATVTVCHEHTEPLDSILWFSDIIVTAVGNREKEPNPKKKFILQADMVRDGAVVVDVGINRVGNKIIGDADFEAVSKKASWITPVPGGVGPCTVAMLLWNTLEATKRTFQ
jgi:methylenetetrahydrofolate dehydrogenase (NADP+)/methenyltetrahydrofolate cyclohydrolase